MYNTSLSSPSEKSKPDSHANLPIHPLPFLTAILFSSDHTQESSGGTSVGFKAEKCSTSPPCHSWASFCPLGTSKLTQKRWRQSGPGQPLRTVSNSRGSWTLAVSASGLFAAIVPLLPCSTSLLQPRGNSSSTSASILILPDTARQFIDKVEASDNMVGNACWKESENPTRCIHVLILTRLYEQQSWPSGTAIRKPWPGIRVRLHPTCFCPPGSHPFAYWRGGALKLYVPDNLRSKVLDWCHSSHLTCHAGITRTTCVVQQCCWWPTRKGNVNEFVSACPV